LEFFQQRSGSLVDGDSGRNARRKIIPVPVRDSFLAENKLSDITMLVAFIVD